MRIESDIKLDFQDVLLKPKRSTMVSRNDVDLIRHFSFLHSDFEWSGVPIISANMTSVTTQRVAKTMAEHFMLSCVPKNAVDDWYSNHYSEIPSLGLQNAIVPDQFNWLCLDVPNGYLEAVVDRTKLLRRNFPWAVIIVGNVVTSEQTEALILAGADIVKVGIGSGAACSTRIKTGVGIPQLSAVVECADAAHGLGGHIISDGGCSTPGDVAKAFAAGADFVMLGGMLAGHTENGTDFYGMSSEKGATEIAGGLKDYRASEGWEMKLKHRGTISSTLQDIEGGLRSTCTYVGAKSLKDLPKCATFVMVNRQANTSLWDQRL